jgi:very-short-patch-repair endonuclease
MPAVADTVESLGGIAKAAELLRRGHSYRAMSWAVARGHLVRARCGWYASIQTPAPSVIALRVGGVLSCISAVESYGLWVMADGRIHVRVDPHSRGLRSPADYRKALAGSWRVRVHWLPRRHSGSCTRSTLIEALVLLTECQPLHLAIASWDSAINTGRLSSQDSERALRALSFRLRNTVRSLVDGRAESGIESIARVRLALAGILSRPQVVIGRRRVDLLIGEHLVVECDGRANHTGELEFEDDRRRDAELTTLGYRVLRFSYRQVSEDWASVEAAVRSALRGVPAEFPALYAASKSTDLRI